MSKFYDQEFEKGKEIGEFGCIWLHTHPSDCTTPSSKDEETFKDTFKRHPWALMLILGKNGSMYGRIKSNFPFISQEVNVSVDWTQWEDEVSPLKWLQQYDEYVSEINSPVVEILKYSGSGFQTRFGTVETREIDAVYDWVDYADFSECQTGMGSHSQFQEWIKAGETAFLAKKDKWQAVMAETRRKLISQMERGTMYESEVRYLLWLNWWLQQEKWAHVYPNHWKLFTQQEGVVIKFTSTGPLMSRIIFDESEIGVVEEFAVGLNKDIPEVGYPALPSQKDTDGNVFTKDNLGGTPCTQALIMDALSHGEKVESNGEVFYFWKERMFHPQSQKVMTSQTTDMLLHHATRCDIQVIGGVK